jgi:hypothetical protein
MWFNFFLSIIRSAELCGNSKLEHFCRYSRKTLQLKKFPLDQNSGSASDKKDKKLNFHSKRMLKTYVELFLSTNISKDLR